ncbi:MFS transporter [Sporolactobacillus terrae]|uniref:MFS transporter n=1 Tax=Sporolactobacillus terrae TaxID=269673 RepID=UPI001119F1A6|nr:MFS transporter [Sporolactobacillus terrae]
MRSKHFHYLWLGQSLANLGDVFYLVGLMALLYRLTDAAVTIAFVPFLSTGSRFVSATIAPIVLEWMGLKRCLAISQTAKTLFLLAFLLTSIALTDRIGSIALAFLILVLISFLDGWAAPARGALVPLLISKKKLLAVNSFLSLLDQCMAMLGWGLGGLLVVQIGSYKLLALTLLLYAISSIGMALIKVNEANAKKANQPKWTLMKKGWLTVWRHPSLRIIFIIDSLSTVADVVWIAAIIYIFVDKVLHVDASWWGSINFSFFAGLMLASLCGMRWNRHIKHQAAFYAQFSSLLACIFTFLFGINSIPIMALVLSLLYGLAVQLKATIFLTIEQTCVPPKQLANVFSAADAVQSVLFAIGSLLIGMLADWLGVRTVFIISAFLLMLECAILFMRRKQLFMYGTRQDT